MVFHTASNVIKIIGIFCWFVDGWCENVPHFYIQKRALEFYIAKEKQNLIKIKVLLNNDWGKEFNHI